MVGDIEATSTLEAIKIVSTEQRDLINRCYQKKGRRFTAQCFGTTEEIVGGQS
jgi:hypothetical protein